MTSATGTYCLFDNHLHDGFNFNEHIFCTTLKAVDDRPAYPTSAAASTDFRSVLESARQAYLSPKIMSDITFPSMGHGHASDTGWIPFEQRFVEPKDLQSLATFEVETTQEFPKMRLPSESSIDDDILDPSSTLEIALSEEREQIAQASRKRRQLGARRIKPKSETHAYRLHQNRVAATAYRMREKEEMEKVRHNFTESRKTNKMLHSTLKRLNDEARDLQKEVLEHCNYVCRKLDCPVWVRISNSYSDTISSSSGSSGSTGSSERTPGTNIFGDPYCVRSPMPIMDDPAVGFEHWNVL